MGLSTTKKARVRWLENLGLTEGTDFSVDGTDGVYIVGLEQLFSWQEIAKKKDRQMIEEFIVGLGIGQQDDEDQKGASDTKAVVVKSLSGHYPELAKLPSLGKTLGKVAAGAKAGCEEQQRHEDQVAQAKEALEDLPALTKTLGEAAGMSTEEHLARLKLAKAVADTVKAEADAVELKAEPASEIPLFKVGFRHGSGKAWVWLSEPFRQAIANEVKELFDGIGGAADYVVGDIAEHIERKCLEAWGFKSRKRRAAAKAAMNYARTVERNLAKGAKGVNQYWAAA